MKIQNLHSFPGGQGLPGHAPYVPGFKNPSERLSFLEKDKTFSEVSVVCDCGSSQRISATKLYINVEQIQKVSVSDEPFQCYRIKPIEGKLPLYKMVLSHLPTAKTNTINVFSINTVYAFSFRSQPSKVILSR